MKIRYNKKVSLIAGTTRLPTNIKPIYFYMITKCPNWPFTGDGNAPDNEQRYVHKLFAGGNNYITYKDI